MSTDTRSEDVLKICPLCGNELKQFLTKVKCMNPKCIFIFRITRAKERLSGK